MIDIWSANSEIEAQKGRKKKKMAGTFDRRGVHRGRLTRRHISALVSRRIKVLHSMLLSKNPKRVYLQMYKE